MGWCDNVTLARILPHTDRANQNSSRCVDVPSPILTSIFPTIRADTTLEEDIGSSEGKGRPMKNGILTLPSAEAELARTL